MEGVGSLQLQHAAQGLKTALQNSGLEAATKAVADARRVAEEATAKDLAAVPLQDRPKQSRPTPGHGLGQHVDIKV